MTKQSLLVAIGIDTFMAGWNEGNVDGLDAVVAPDFRRQSPGGLSVEGSRRSRRS